MKESTWKIDRELHHKGKKTIHVPLPFSQLIMYDGDDDVHHVLIISCNMCIFNPPLSSPPSACNFLSLTVSNQIDSTEKTPGYIYSFFPVSSDKVSVTLDIV